jgi:hypothetical protein
MELSIGHVIQYKDDDWSYIIRDVELNRENGEILYECISPEGGDHTMVWCHNLEELIKAIDEGEISIISNKEHTPIKNFPKFKF